MIERIFISTNANLHGIFGGRDYANLQTKLTNSGLYLLDRGENHKVYYNGTGFDLATAASNIIVVKDSSEISLTGINPNTDMLLHHTQTDNHIINVVEKFEGKKVKGRHPDLYYTDVFKIIFDDNNQKFERIIKYLLNEELESALNILHDIYHGKAVSEVKSEYTSILNDPKYGDLIENLDISKFNYENDEHHQKLAKLRDELLKLTLANQSS